MLPSALDAARGAFACPAVSKLRGLAGAGPGRRHEAHAAVIELRAFLDAQFRSSMFASLLSVARLKDRELPDHVQWMAGWERIKGRMGTDGKFVAALCDRLPEVLARYSLSNAVQIFGDPTIRELAAWGMR